MRLPYYDMTPGDVDQPTLAAGGQRLAATICYEDAYGGDQLGNLDVATLLVNVTNDAWYGTTSAPHQHLAMVAFRAIENRRYLVRAANTGITCGQRGAKRQPDGISDKEGTCPGMVVSFMPRRETSGNAANKAWV